MKNLELRFFAGSSGLAELTSDWQQLQSQLADVSYYQTCEWHNSVASHLHADSEQSVFLAAYSDQVLRAVFPFRYSVDRKLGLPIRTLSFASHSHIFRNDILVDPAFEGTVSWNSMIEYAEEQIGFPFDRVCLGQVAETSCTYRTLCAEEFHGVAPNQVVWGTLIDCSGSFEDNIAHIPARTRRNIRRLERRALQDRDVLFLSYRGKEISPEVILSFMDIENDGWKGRGQTSILSDLSLRNFYESLVANSDQRHECQINFLSVAGKEVAGQLGIVSNGALHILKIGYRQAYANIAPGNLLLMYAIKEASGIDDISTIKLQTAPTWSRKWASFAERIRTHLILRPTPMGRILLHMNQGRRIVGQVARRLGLIRSNSAPPKEERQARRI